MSGCEKLPNIVTGLFNPGTSSSTDEILNTNTNVNINTNTSTTTPDEPTPPAEDPEIGITVPNTYTNEKYGFEFQYPINWFVYADRVENEITIIHIASPADKDTPEGTTFLGPMVDIRIPADVGNTIASDTGWKKDDIGSAMSRKVTILGNPNISFTMRTAIDGKNNDSERKILDEIFSTLKIDKKNTLETALLENKLEISKKFTIDFESINDFDSFYITDQNHLDSTSHNLSTERSVSGNSSHKAWTNKTNQVIKGENTNHRGYPTIQFQKTSTGVMKKKVFVEFWVWLDAGLENIPNKDWLSFATFTSYIGDNWPRTLLVNLDANNVVHLMHLPNQSQKNPDIFQTKNTKFPQKQWVKISTYIDYTNNNKYNSPYAQVWQDDKLVSAGRFNPRLDLSTIDKNLWPSCLDNWNGKNIDDAEELCNEQFTNGLAQAHFGLYAPPLVDNAVIYNDELKIYELK